MERSIQEKSLLIPPSPRYFKLGDYKMEYVLIVEVETTSFMLQDLEPGIVKPLMVQLFIKKINQQVLQIEDKFLPLLAHHWAGNSRIVQPHVDEQEKAWFIDFEYSLASPCFNNHVFVVFGKENIINVLVANRQKLKFYVDARHACANSSFNQVDQWKSLIDFTCALFPHFGIAKGAQQIQHQPSMASGVTVASPMRILQRVPPSLFPSEVKSCFQEKLVGPPPQPRAAHPISTCFGTNDFLDVEVTSSKVVLNCPHPTRKLGDLTEIQMEHLVFNKPQQLAVKIGSTLIAFC